MNRFSNLFYCVCVHALIWINRKSSKPAGFFCSPVTCVWCLHSEWISWFQVGSKLVLPMFQCLFHCLLVVFNVQRWISKFAAVFGHLRASVLYRIDRPVAFSLSPLPISCTVNRRQIKLFRTSESEVWQSVDSNSSKQFLKSLKIKISFFAKKSACRFLL